MRSGKPGCRPASSFPVILQLPPNRQNPRSGSDASVIQPLIQAWDLVKVTPSNGNPTANPKLLIANRISSRGVRSPIYK